MSTNIYNMKATKLLLGSSIVSSIVALVLLILFAEQTSCSSLELKLFQLVFLVSSLVLIREYDRL